MKQASGKWLRQAFEQSTSLSHGTASLLTVRTVAQKHRTCIPSIYQRCYTGTSFHVPSAYRIYNNHFRNDSLRKNPYKKDSSSPVTKEARKYPLQDDIRNLVRLENEAKSILKLYAAALIPGTTQLHHISSGKDSAAAAIPTESSLLTNDWNNNNIQTLQSTPTIPEDKNTTPTITWEQLEVLSVSLQQSEDKYRHLCVKIRQLVAGWASLRPSSTTDLSKYHKFVNLSQLFRHYILEGDTVHKNHLETLDIMNSLKSNNTMVHLQLNPSKRAEDYIILLDELRIHRASMIQLALSEYYNDPMARSLEMASPKDFSFGKGVMKWMKTLFSSGVDTHPTSSTPASLELSQQNSMTSSSNDASQDPSTRILALKAHESSNFTSNARLYKEVMKSFIHWHSLMANEMRSRLASSYHAENDEEVDDENGGNFPRWEADRLNMTIVQNQSLANELDRLFESVKHIYHDKKNRNVLPDRDMYHIVMKQHARLGTYTGALRVIQLLHDMKEAASTLTSNPSHHSNMDHPVGNNDPTATATPIRRFRHGQSLDKGQDSTAEIHPLDAFKPTLQSYCIALRACRNFVACPSVDNVNRKFKIVDLAIDLLIESESFSSAKVWIDGEDLIGTEADSDLAPSLGSVGLEPIDPTWSTRIITLSIMNLAGHKVVPDLCSRVDALMIKFIGEKAFLKLIGEDGLGTVSDVKVDLAICHLIIEIYNRKKDKRYANRAKAVLRYMEAMVQDSKWNSSGLYPCTNTFNSVIKCMHQGERTLENAEAATRLLDSMVRRQSSMPNRTTFNGILSLWSYSDSPEAGEKASSMLARMEMLDMLQAEASIRPNMRSYELALKCWSLAAFKGYPSAAKRAYGLLKSMEAQCSTLILKEPLVESRLRRGEFAHAYNNELCPEPSVYSYVIYAASKTVIEGDKAEALQLAFDVYNRLLDRKLIPTKMMFLNLIHCCNLVPETMSEHRKLLLKRIIESMPDEYQSDKDITQALRVFQ